MVISSPEKKIFAVYKHVKSDDYKSYDFKLVDHNDLRIFDKKCYATYAGDGELIIILRDEE